MTITESVMENIEMTQEYPEIRLIFSPKVDKKLKELIEALVVVKPDERINFGLFH